MQATTTVRNCNMYIFGAWTVSILGYIVSRAKEYLRSQRMSRANPIKQKFEIDGITLTLFYFNDCLYNRDIQHNCLSVCLGDDETPRPQSLSTLSATKGKLQRNLSSEIGLLSAAHCQSSAPYRRDAARLRSAQGRGSGAWLEAYHLQIGTHLLQRISV